MLCPTPDKRPYLTLRNAAESMIWTYERFGVWQRPYRCDPGCGSYHLTTKDLEGEFVTDEQAHQLLDAVGL